MLAQRQLQVVEPWDKLTGLGGKKNGKLYSEVVNNLAALAVSSYHPKGSVLFAEGQHSLGVFILYSGRVKLFTSSPSGKTLILRFANPSEILGLAGALSGKPHEAWAETTQPARIGFITRERFIRAMGCQSELVIQVANLLAESYLSVIVRMRKIGLFCSAKQKLAVFLLDWFESNRALNDNDGAPFTFTHEEIAQVIGSTRETVTRTLAVFEETRLIRWKASNLVLMDRSALEKSAANLSSATCGGPTPLR